MRQQPLATDQCKEALNILDWEQLITVSDGPIAKIRWSDVLRIRNALQAAISTMEGGDK